MPKKAKIDFTDTAAKKAAVTARKKSSKLPVIAALAVFILIAGGGLYYLSSGPNQAAQLPSAASSAATEAAGPRMDATTVSLPVSLFEDGQAHYYQHQTDNGLTIRFFVLKSSDGIIRAAFDACDVCWPANKGYAQEGDVMVCRNCGRRFPSVKINEVKGGCNPAPLKRRLENGRLIFEKTDILDGGQYFNFSNAQAGPSGRTSRG